MKMRCDRPKIEGEDNDALQGLNKWKRKKDSSLSMANQRYLHCSLQKERMGFKSPRKRYNNKSTKRKAVA